MVTLSPLLAIYCYQSVLSSFSYTINSDLLSQVSHGSNATFRSTKKILDDQDSLNQLSTRNVSGVCSEDTVNKNRIFWSQNFPKPEFFEAWIFRSLNLKKLEFLEAGIWRQIFKARIWKSQNFSKLEFEEAWIWRSLNLEKLEFEKAVIGEKTKQTVPW